MSTTSYYYLLRRPWQWVFNRFKYLWEASNNKSLSQPRVSFPRGWMKNEIFDIRLSVLQRRDTSSVICLLLCAVIAHKIRPQVARYER